MIIINVTITMATAIICNDDEYNFMTMTTLMIATMMTGITATGGSLRCRKKETRQAAKS